MDMDLSLLYWGDMGVDGNNDQGDLLLSLFHRQDNTPTITYSFEDVPSQDNIVKIYKVVKNSTPVIQYSFDNVPAQDNTVKIHDVSKDSTPVIQYSLEDVPVEVYPRNIGPYNHEFLG